jgi:ribonuclease P protein component
VQRLKTHSQFQAVLAGQRIASTAHFVLHRRSVTDFGWRPASQHAARTGLDAAESPSPHAFVIGAMVPKRWAKRAVTRNMIKRQIYSVGAQAASALPCAAYVVRLRAGFDRQQFVSASSVALKRAVRQELLALFASVQRPGRSGFAPQPVLQP